MVGSVLKKRVWMALAVTAGLASGAPALAKNDALLLEPVSNWTLDYAVDSCALRRTFAQGERRMTLEMRQFEPNGGSTQFIFASSDIRSKSSGNPNNVKLRYIPDAEEIKPRFVFGMSWESGAEGISFLSSLDGSDSLDEEEKDKIGDAEMGRVLLEREETITGIAVRNAFRDDIQILTGTLAKPMAAMRICLDELMGHWGIDVEAHRTLSKPLERVNFRRWARAISNDYPEALYELGEQGVLRVRMSVSADGKATACNIQSQLGKDEFREKACDLMLSRAEYSPALDAQGNPIASFDILSIFYVVR